VRRHVGPDGLYLLLDGQLSVVVRPGARGRGLGGRLIAQALEDYGAGGLDAWSHGDHPAAARLAAACGFRPARSLWVMRRPVEPAESAPPELVLPESAPPESAPPESAPPGSALPELVVPESAPPGSALPELVVPESALPGPALPQLVLPEGLTIRGYTPGDAGELLAVNAAAFAAHPEQGAMNATDLAERMAEPWFDPAGLLIAHLDGRLAGFHWTKRHSPTVGEVYVVGIDPALHGRGLGKVLTLAGLHHLARLGLAESLLYVEAGDAPALAGDSGLGFTHAAHDTHVMYHRA
jgi:mycothiol synthase